jgi:hypothetical protein
MDSQQPFATLAATEVRAEIGGIEQSRTPSAPMVLACRMEYPSLESLNPTETFLQPDL